VCPLCVAMRTQGLNLGEGPCLGERIVCWPLSVSALLLVDFGTNIQSTVPVQILFFNRKGPEGPRASFIMRWSTFYRKA
jgi:hypothetical protein